MNMLLSLAKQLRVNYFANSATTSKMW